MKLLKLGWSRYPKFSGTSFLSLDSSTSGKDNQECLPVLFIREQLTDSFERTSLVCKEQGTLWWWHQATVQREMEAELLLALRCRLGVRYESCLAHPNSQATAARCGCSGMLCTYTAFLGTDLRRSGNYRYSRFVNCKLFAPFLDLCSPLFSIKPDLVLQVQASSYGKRKIPLSLFGE